MKGLIVSVAAAACASAAFAAHVVQTGSIAEGGHGVGTAETLTRDGCGTLLNLFHGKWTPEKIRAVGEHCRKHGCTFTVDEMFSRWSGRMKGEYEPQKDALLAAIRDYADVCEGTQHYSESGGLMFYWHPHDAMHRGRFSPRIAKGGNSLAQAYESSCAQTRQDLLQAKALGLPEPIFSIECAFGFAPYLMRAGYDRVDLEVVYSDELERAYAGVKTAAEAFGRKRFGTDMAMEWYGGMQSDGLWEARWRTSLYHAYIRGADPIYNEHGLMSHMCHGRKFGHDHPVSKRYRKVLADFTTWCKAHPRADGYPLATVGAIQGRFDGYAGIFQTHLFGQRTNEAFRVTEADRTAWRLFDGLYRRRGWQERDSWGDADYSGNPPLGAAGILPFDVPPNEFAKYRLLFFLGRNVMDDVLYAKLVDYVKGGGTLMLAASHLTAQDAPNGAFAPYNGGDWSALAGVKMGAGKPWHLPHGMKFMKNPGPGWNFQPLTDTWDPDFIEGGFDVPELEATTATPFIVASDRFHEKKIAECKGLGFVNEIGKGRVIFLASLDSPGAFGVRKLYSYLMAKAMEAIGTDVWPKVECSDTVRWSVYPDGTIYLLNTEAHLAQEAVVENAAGAPRLTVRLEPGEVKSIPSAPVPFTAPYTPDVAARPQVRGVMLSQYAVGEDDFKTLREWGATVARYQMYPVGERWKGKTSDADGFAAWLDWKLGVLKNETLPLARKYGIPLVVDLHVPPGGRGGSGMKMLDDPAWADFFVDCWRKIASLFKGEKEIYAYDLINEPTQFGEPKVCDYLEIQRRAARAIRQIDAVTPIIVSCNADGAWCAPSAFKSLKPLDLVNVFYQFHMYEPFAYTHQKVLPQFKETVASYPDAAKGWDAEGLRRIVAPVRAFEKRYGARIFVGEFSAVAYAKGSDRWIADVGALLNEQGWDWCYHAFREWPGWSVEHEVTAGDSAATAKFASSADNPRRRALLSALRR